VVSEVKVAQSRLTLCDPLGFTVHGILQARTLEWVASPFSRGTFPIEGLNPGLLHCGRILYPLSHQGSPSEKVALCKPRREVSGEAKPVNLLTPFFWTSRLQNWEKFLLFKAVVCGVLQWQR